MYHAVAAPDAFIFLSMDYWHSRPERVEQDLIQRSELAWATIDGKRVERVIDVWERRLLAANRKHVVLAASNGEELGQ